MTPNTNVVVLLEIGSGTFEQGFPVILRILEEGRVILEERGKLPPIPPAPQIPQLYREWQQRYNRLGQSRAILVRSIQPVSEQPTHESVIQTCKFATEALENYLRQWFQQGAFQTIRDRILAQAEVRRDNSVPVVIATHTGDKQRDTLLRKLSWHQWDLFDKLRQAELVLHAGFSRPIAPLPHPVKILAIFGSSEGGLELQHDQAELEQLQPAGATITALEQPTREALHNALCSQAWDILFFAGHSFSEGHCQTGFIQVSDGRSPACTADWHLSQHHPKHEQHLQFSPATVVIFPSLTHDKWLMTNDSCNRSFQLRIMHNTLDHLIQITVSLTASDRRQAETFAQVHSHPEKAAQVFRNTLAVLATHHYLQMVGIASNPEMGWGWQQVGRLLDNAADLYLPEKKGHLECRSVGAGDTKCWIPETVQSDRIGYVVVQLDEPYHQGQLLGFVPSVSVTELPLSYLQPLDDLIDCVTITEPIPILSQWLQRIFPTHWELRQELLRPTRVPILPMGNLEKENAQELVFRGKENTQELAIQVERLYQKQSHQSDIAKIQAIAPDPKQALIYLIQMTQDDEIRWQAAELLWEIDPDHAIGAVKSAKDLGLYLSGHQIALMVGILPKPDGRMLILTRVYPIEQEPHLPSGLQLTGLDEESNVFFNITARRQDDYIQFKFTADVGDRFTLQVSFNDSSVTESFIV